MASVSEAGHKQMEKNTDFLQEDMNLEGKTELQVLLPALMKQIASKVFACT